MRKTVKTCCAFFSILTIFLLQAGCKGQVMNAFDQVTNSLNNQNLLRQQTVDSLYRIAELIDPIIPLVHAQSVSYRNYIDSLENLLIKQAGGRKDRIGEIAKGDDIDIPTKLLFESGEGELLKERMIAMRVITANTITNDSTKAKVLALLTPNDYQKNSSWSKYCFYHVPVTAAVTILTKFKNDSYSAEELFLRDYIVNHPK